MLLITNIVQNKCLLLITNIAHNKSLLFITHYKVWILSITILLSTLFIKIVYYLENNKGLWLIINIAHNKGLPQFCSGLHPSAQSQQQSKKPGEGK